MNDTYFTNKDVLNRLSEYQKYMQKNSLSVTHPEIAEEYNKIRKLKINVKKAYCHQPIMFNSIIDKELSCVQKVFTQKLINHMKKLQEEELACENISITEFENRYAKVHDKCIEVGSKGWVASPYSNFSATMDWYRLLQQSDGNEKIATEFERGNNSILNQIIDALGNLYTTQPEHQYFHSALEAFNQGDYLSAAMSLFALLEERTSLILDPEFKRNSVKYSEKGYFNKMEAVYKGDKGFFSRRIIIVEMYPSLIAFTKRAFVEPEAYKFENGIEPPYLNRNWLMHGKMRRNVERYECIQIMNAISALEFIMDCSI